MARIVFWLLWGALAFGVWRVIRRKRRATSSAPERVVACTWCGVHVPHSQACWAEGRAYCQEAHRQEGGRQHTARSS